MEWLKTLLEAIKKVAGDDADLTAIEETIKTGVKGEVEKATEPLANKRDEVLTEKKKLQDKLRLFDGIDPERYNSLKQQLEALELKEVFEVGDLDAVKDALAKKHGTELAAKETEIESLRSDLHNLLVDQGLTNALMGNRVAEQFIPAVKALLKDGVQITTGEDGKRIATVGDVPLADYVKTWAGSDEGKSYVVATKDSGGDSGGDGGSGSDPKDTKARYAELMAKEDPLTASESVELNGLAEKLKEEQQNAGGE